MVTALARKPVIVDAGPRRPDPMPGQADYDYQLEAWLYTQRFTSSVRRRDGNTIDGHAGDCARAAMATLLQLDPEKLQHYAERVDWWAAMRRDVRRLLPGVDLAYVPLDQNVVSTWTVARGTRALADGQSPRGSFAHIVVCEVVDWPLVVLLHDPHPSRLGLASLYGLYVLVSEPYDIPPPLALPMAGGAR